MTIEKKKFNILKNLSKKRETLINTRDNLSNQLVGDDLEKNSLLGDYADTIEELKDVRDEIDLIAAEIDKLGKEYEDPFSSQNMFKLINDINNIYKKQNGID